MLASALQPLRTLKGKNVAMSSGFEPSEYCVICGRGKQSYRHAGNRRFRLAITMYMDRYEQAKTKLDKSLIVVGLVDAIRSYNGGFVKRNTKQQGQWIDIGDILAREKVGHALRDALASREAGDGPKIDPEKFGEIKSISDLMTLSSEELEDLENRIKTRQTVSSPPKAVSKKKNNTECSTTPSIPSLKDVQRTGFGQSRDNSSDSFSPIKIGDWHKIDLDLLCSLLQAGGDQAIRDASFGSTSQGFKLSMAEFEEFVIDVLSDSNDDIQSFGTSSIADDQEMTDGSSEVDFVPYL